MSCRRAATPGGALECKTQLTNENTMMVCSSTSSSSSSTSTSSSTSSSSTSSTPFFFFFLKYNTVFASRRSCHFLLTTVYLSV